MKAAGISEIKGELKNLPSAKLIELTLRLARYKKENKELLTYLLFEESDLEGYIKNIKEEIREDVTAITTANLYFVKKSLRKIVRFTNKHIKYTASKVAEAELLIYFCQSLKKSKIPIKRSTALVNLYNGQLKKIKAAIDTLHEDLQYEYLQQWEELNG